MDDYKLTAENSIEELNNNYNQIQISVVNNLSVVSIAFSEKNNSENAEVFFKSLLNYGWGEPGNGFLYDEAFEGFSSVGWYTLGWFHVVVFITSIEINGNLIEIDEETQEQYGIQMVRSDPEDLFMYFFNL